MGKGLGASPQPLSHIPVKVNIAISKLSTEGQNKKSFLGKQGQQGYTCFPKNDFLFIEAF